MSEPDLLEDSGRADLARIAGSCAALSVRRASRAVTHFYDNALAPSGIGIAQMGLLIAIQLHTGATRTEIAHVLVMDRTTLVRNLKLLEREGLIETTEGEDRRTRAISLTDKGGAAIKAAYPYWQEAQRLLVDQVGTDEWDAVRSGLKSLEGLYEG